jgi:hypothetical protein
MPARHLNGVGHGDGAVFPALQLFLMGQVATSSNDQYGLFRSDTGKHSGKIKQSSETGSDKNKVVFVIQFLPGNKFHDAPYVYLCLNNKTSVVAPIIYGNDQITNVSFTHRIQVGWVSFSVTQHFPAAVGLRCANPTYKV